MLRLVKHRHPSPPAPDPQYVVPPMPGRRRKLTLLALSLASGVLALAGMADSQREADERRDVATALHCRS